MYVSEHNTGFYVVILININMSIKNLKICNKDKER